MITGSVPQQDGSYLIVRANKSGTSKGTVGWIIATMILAMILAAVFLGGLSIFLPVPLFASVYASKCLNWRWRWHLAPAIILTLFMTYVINARWLLDMS